MRTVVTGIGVLLFLAHGSWSCSSSDNNKCTSDVPCQTDLDCGAGYACNSALDPPMCHLLGCAGPSEPCPNGGDRFCWTGLKCIEPPLPSATPGDFQCWGVAGQTCVNDGHCCDDCFCDNSIGECVSVDTGESWGMTVVVYGPSPALFPESDPFSSCDIVELCWALAGTTLLKSCQDFAYDEVMAGDAHYSTPTLPSVQVVASCYGKSEQGVLTGPTAQGWSVPLVARPDTPVKVYLLPMNSFGPTTEAPVATGLSYGPPTTPNSPRWGAAVAPLYDHTVLIAGGGETSGADFSEPGTVQPHAGSQSYDPATGEYTTLGSDLSEPRAFCAVATLPSGEVAIFGGIDMQGEPSSRVDIFNPAIRKFKQQGQVPEMQETRAFHTATLISSDGYGFVLLVGGMGSGDKHWEVWTPALGAIASGDLKHKRWNHTATHISPENDPKARPMVFIAGGEGESENAYDTVEIFDIENQAVDSTMPWLCSNDGSNAAGKTMHAAVFVPARHFIYVAGGFKDSQHQLPARDICVWQTTKETWQGQAGMFLLKRGRGAHTGTPLPHNAVLFAGGLVKGPGEALVPAESVEIVFEYLNANGETVVDIGPDDSFPINMLYPRFGHTAVNSADNKVLFVGGLSGSPGSPTVVYKTEVFNP